jgi:fatty acid desaturase
MYWIITFAAMLFIGCLSFVFAAQFDLLSAKLIPYIGLGIFGFVALFSAVVGYLVFIWSHEYKQEQSKQEESKNK